MQLPQQYLFINGQARPAQDGNTFINIAPATGTTLCEVSRASQVDVNTAVAGALATQQQWASTSGAERGRILLKVAELLRARNDELAELETWDTGKPVQESRVIDVLSSADCFAYFGGIAASLHGQHFDLGHSFAYTRREPLGVCAGIGAWNYPLQIACWKAAPALACGNAMVYKPSELTPLTALKLAEIFIEAGLPAGVFNVVQGFADVGQWLCTHPDIAKVSLTGSVSTGKKVMHSAADGLKHITLELGGKSPLIIFDDAHLDNAVAAAMMANFYTQGEVCSNGTRVFVHENIMDAFLEQLKQRTERLIIGDPLHSDTQVGALISRDHFEKVRAYLEQGIQGAQCLTGGKQRQVAGCEGGYFIEPTVFYAVDPASPLAMEEVFGPVMCVFAFNDEAQVVQAANNTLYGLAAGVFTRDIQRAHRVVAQLKAGTCWINNYNLMPIEVPFGGYKQSGIGRENSLAAIEHYTQLKSVYVEMGDVETTY